MAMWIHGWKALTLGYHTATFGGFRHSGNRDKIFLVCRVISKDHVFKGLCDFMGGNTSICDVTFQDYTWSNGLVTLWKGRQLLIVWSHPARPDGQRHFGSGDMFLIYHVTSREHMFKGLCDFFVSHHFVKFNDHRPSGSKDVTDVTVFPIWKSL